MKKVLKLKITNNHTAEKPSGQEIAVERKPVAAAIKVWNILMMAVSGFFTLTGVAGICIPALRASLFAIFLQFVYEIGLL